MMGFFDFIKQLFAPNLDEKIKRISIRIDELRRHVPTSPIISKSLDSNIFDIASKATAKDLKTFVPRSISGITTMRSLKEKRIELDKKRIQELRHQVLLNLSSIKDLINREEADKAAKLLVDTLPTIKQVNDTEILNTYTQLLSEVTKLKEILRQREVERRRTKRKKEEEERRKNEIAEQERKVSLEQERLRKERKATEYEEKLRSEAQKRALERKRLVETVTCKKTDGDKFLDYLKRKGITYFYHFTDEHNIASIRRLGGLFSWYYCENNNIIIPNAGGDSSSRSLDCRHGLEDYVRLSFCSDHPMQYRLQQGGARLVLLKIKVDVAAFKDTQFSNMNAAANAVQHGSSFEDLERVNIYAVKQTYVRKTDDIFQEHQAECMVKTFIPVQYITNIDHPQRL